MHTGGPTTGLGISVASGIPADTPTATAGYKERIDQSIYLQDDAREDHNSVWATAWFCFSLAAGITGTGTFSETI